MNLNWNKILKGAASACAIIAIMILTGDDADARPGGGHSSHHSGGGHSGGGSGSGEGFIMLLRLIAMIWNAGPIGKIICLALLAFIVYKLFIKEADSDDSVSVFRGAKNMNHDHEVREGVRKYDPKFSTVIFKDFVGLLFMRFMSLRGRKSNFNEIKPFFSIETLTEEDTKDKATYTEIAINSIELESFDDDELENDYYVTVHIRADYTRSINGKSTRQQSNVMWQLRRYKNVTTVEPSDNTRICCPHCGANETFTDAGTCKHCGQAIRPGQSTWQVTYSTTTNVVLDFQDTCLTYSDTDDETLSVNTIEYEGWRGEVARIAEKDGAGSQEMFEEDFRQNVVTPAILAIYNSWSKNSLNDCRHLLTDRQYESMKIWTLYLAEHGAFNKLDNIKVHDIRIVDAACDEYYDTITCEIRISCADYMVNIMGKKLAGHTSASQFKELFTFARGAHAKGRKISLNTCPSCGAPADKMGETAICEYCGSKISTGKFSWVLAGIEQVC